MAENIFTRIARNKPTTILPRHIKKAREWFRDQAAKIANVNQKAVLQNSRKKIVQRINEDSLGSMYFYQYDPKLKEKLPYYDMFPMAFIIEIYSDGWLGLNLHYLPPRARAMFMDALYRITKEEQGEKKIQATYELMKGAKRFRLFKPCLKKYLFAHVKSQILEIDDSEWDMAMMLPMQRFVKANEEEIWRKSIEKAG